MGEFVAWVSRFLLGFEWSGTVRSWITHTKRVVRLIGRQGVVCARPRETSVVNKKAPFLGFLQAQIESFNLLCFDLDLKCPE